MNNLESKIRGLNREILNLKTAHPLKANMITFYGEYHYKHEWDNRNHKYEITYVEGDQPIITFQLYNGSFFDSIFGEPVGNKQIMYDINAAHAEGKDLFVLASTRQILSVRYIS